MVTSQLVKELREKTGAGMMDCKKALDQVEGDIEKAIEFLREKGLAAASKKSGRIAAEGAVGFYADKNKAGLVEINCETDFVAKNEKFQNFVNETAKNVTEGETDFADKASAMIAEIGENIVVRRFEKYDLTGNGIVGGYIHLGGKIGVMVEVNCNNEKTADSDEFKALAKDIAMQIAASNPTYLSINDVPADVVEKERNIFKVQAMNEGKPENIAEKMVEGRLHKRYKEICLLEEPFVKDDSLSIAALLKNKSAELKDEITVTRFVRYMMGEGLEKKNENFAEEIAKQINK